jgi:hypothetical protein
VLDLEKDLPMSPDDVAALRQARRDVPSWLMLDPATLVDLLPEDALDRRALARDTWRPFSLE